MIAGLILAAGESSRMGRDKALLTYRSKTFLENIVETLRTAEVERIAVVLGHHADEIRRAVNLEGVEWVVNPDYRSGQTSSLQAGLRVLAADSPEAVVLCLVDHPAVSAETVRELVKAFRDSGAPIAIPVHKHQRGHPVVISRGLFGELLGLGANHGANTVIRKHRDQARFLEVEDPGILLDVDDLETYRGLRSRKS